MDYPYVNGVVKALETRLLDKNKLAKLAKADRSNFLKTLMDIGYGRMIPGDDVETVLMRELTDFQTMINEITPDKHATNLFLLTEDAMNIKLLFKQKKLAASLLPDSIAEGSIPFAGISKAILESDERDLGPRFRTLLRNIDALTEGVDAGALSSIVDRELFAFALRTLGSFGNEAFKAYLRAKIDFINVMSLLRIRKLRWDSTRLDTAFIPGGRYPLPLLHQAFEVSFVEMAKLLQDHYDEKVSKIVREQSEKKSLALIEIHFFDLLMEVVSAYRYDGFTIGPVIYYYLEKTKEADTIRTLYARALESPVNA